MTTGTRADDLIRLGRKVAAAQGLLDDRAEGEWLAYGQACQDALARGRSVPRLLPSSVPAWPPAVSRTPAVRVAPLVRAPVDAAPSSASPARPRPANAQRAGRMVLHPPVAVLCAACARPVEVGPRQGGSFLGSVARGLIWRYSVLGAILFWAQSHAQTPWPAIGAVLLGGLILGLWCRRGAPARLWRTLVVAGGAVYVAPLVSVYPDVLVGSIGLLTVAPVLAAWRR